MFIPDTMGVFENKVLGVVLFLEGGRCIVRKRGGGEYSRDSL